MSESEFSNPLKLAGDNLQEANRQLERATDDYNNGRISRHRLDQLHELRDIAVEDLARVVKER
ncbi:hypothetical protein [Specibacter sp. RAF43]|uniref:hypothetical protein n=1 Tax=Specibacter sp. RAF43 TaxID=3233057 RepID=UPI003F946418